MGKQRNKFLLQRTSPGLVNLVAIAVAIIMLFAALLSFSAQLVLAKRGGISPLFAWAWPVIVDGTILVSTIAVFIFHNVHRGRSRYAWFILVVFGSISILANGAHSTNMALSTTERFLVGAVPALGLFLVTHLFVMLASDSDPSHTKKETAILPEAERPEVAPPPAPKVPVRQPTPTSGIREPVPVAHSVGSQPAVEHTKDETETWVLDQLRKTGKVPSGQAVADYLGRSRSVGSRFRTELAKRNQDVATAMGIPTRPRLVQTN